MTAFEKWLRRYDNPELGPDAKCLSDEAVAIANDAWNACAAEAERLCRARVLDPGEHECLACENCADAIRGLRETE